MMMFAAGHTCDDPLSTFHNHHHRSSSIQHIQPANRNASGTDNTSMANPKRRRERSNSLTALISFNLDLNEETEPSSPAKNDNDDDVFIDLNAASKHIISDAQLWSDFQRRLRESKKTHSNANAQQILIDIIQEYNDQSSEMATSDHDQLPRIYKPKPKVHVERTASMTASTRSSDNVSNLAALSSVPSNDSEKGTIRRRATMDTLFTSFSARSCNTPENSNNPKKDTNDPPIITRTDDIGKPATCSSTSCSPPSAEEILNRNETSSAANHRQSSFSGRIAQLAMRTRLSLADEEVDT